MLHLGKSSEEVALCLGIHKGTVANYVQKYQSEGLDAYLEDNYVAYQGKLSEEEKGISSQELKTNLYQNTAQTVPYVRETFWQVLHLSRYCTFVALFRF